MCILFIYTNPKPEENGYRLIIASNRDEFYKRPAKKTFLCEKTNIIGGRDMEPGREGGMWLGAAIKNNNKGKKLCFGALLNLTGEERKFGVIGRGFVVTDYLKTNQSLEEYLKCLEQIPHNAFNLVSVEISKDDATTVHYTSVQKEKDYYEGKQILGFGNSTTDVPLIKVKHGKKKFEDIIKQNLPKEELIENLLNLLKCPERHFPDPELQRRAPSTHEYLSSIFVSILHGGYGTRTHSILIVDYDWNVEFIEHTMKEPIEDAANPEWEVTVIRSQL